MKRFAYACIGVLALALTFHLGAEMARAGATGPFVGIASIVPPGPALPYLIAIAADGEWWLGETVTFPPRWGRGGIIGGASALEPSTWGGIKARARDR